MRDIFQPTRDPARSIYNAFHAEAEKRNERSVDEWMAKELAAVHRESVIQAQALGLRAPSMAEVQAAERYAMGSADYGAKWAYGVAEAMRKPASENA